MTNAAPGGEQKADVDGSVGKPRGGHRRRSSHPRGFVLAVGVFLALSLLFAPGTEAATRTVTVNFRTMYNYEGRNYALPRTNIFIYNNSGRLIARRTSDSRGRASIVLSRRTRIQIRARKVQGTCPPRQYAYYGDWRWTVPASGPNPIRVPLVLDWMQVC